MSAYQNILEQYHVDASFLWVLRSIAVTQPNYLHEDLKELDRKIDASLDGLMTSLETAWGVCEQALELGEPGEVFSTTVTAFRSRDIRKIKRVVDVGLSSIDTFPGLVSALGWLPAQVVHEWVKQFLHSKNLDHKHLAIAACSIRRENPGEWLNRILQRDDCREHHTLLCRALRLVGELKRQDLKDRLEEQFEIEDKDIRFWALRSSIMLGNRGVLGQLYPYALATGPHQNRAINLLLSTLPIHEAQTFISRMAEQPEMSRQVIISSGWLGDPHAVKWLISRIHDPSMARISGEAFMAITGIDLEQQELTSEPPTGLSLQPNNEPDDDNVDLDEDENLPWPDAEKIQAFWKTHGSKFVSGQRYFFGRPINVATLKEMLPSLNMRQRHRAALEIALTDANEPYINTQAKTHHQRK